MNVEYTNPKVKELTLEEVEKINKNYSFMLTNHNNQKNKCYF
jgi:hypothetical protein